jgi:hypothetical protein
MRAREKMAAVRRGVTLRRKRVREDAAVRRGVTLRRRRVVRKVARIRKRVTRMCGMRCRKPCQRWSMKSLTRLPRPSKVSSVATLFGIIPSVSAVLGYV